MPEKSVAQILGENLKRIRKSKKYSRKQCADVVGIDENSFGRYERGETLAPLDKIFKIARFFEVSINDLIGDEENYIARKIFEYRLKRAWQLTAFLEPVFNYDGFLGSDTPQYTDGQIKVYSAEKIEYDKGVITTYGKTDEIFFKSEQDFVRIMEQAEYNALLKQSTLNEEFRKIVD